MSRHRQRFKVTDFSLRIWNCDFANWMQRCVYTSDGTETPLDSVLVKNSTFKDGVKQAFYLKGTRNGSDIFPGGYTYCKIENCLVTGLTSDSDGHATYIEPGNRDVGDQGWPTVILDHLTVDNCPRGISTYTTPGALVQNCIVSNPTVVDRTSIDIQSGRFADAPPSMLKNSIYIGALNLQGSSTVVSLTENVDSVDAIYVDRENGDYALAENSPGKNGATDGKDIGYIAPGSSTIGVPHVSDISVMNVFPNPTSGMVQISFSKDLTEVKSLEIFDMTGKLISRITELKGRRTITIDMSASPSGVYFGKAISTHGVHSFKLLKN